MHDLVTLVLEPTCFTLDMRIKHSECLNILLKESLKYIQILNIMINRSELRINSSAKLIV